jgi:hypothetical protein
MEAEKLVSKTVRKDLYILIGLKGTQSPEPSKSGKMPYGLNHRRSLENLVPNGSLKVFNAVNYHSKKSPFKQNLLNEKLNTKVVNEPTYFTCKQFHLKFLKRIKVRQ